MWASKVLQINPVLCNVRCFSHSPVLNAFIHQITKTVDPFSRFKIKTSVNLKIVPFNLFDCPDSNIMRVTFNTKDEKLNLDLLKFDINDKEVTIFDDFNQQNIDCFLEIPIKADLHIEAKRNVKISDLYSDQVIIRAKENVKTKNLRSTKIDINSEDGQIRMDGITLAADINLETCKKGDVVLDKLQGELIVVKTQDGAISTNSCYITSSKFETHNGKLSLKNMHKNCELIMHGESDLEMTGFYGNLKATTKSKNINIQLSEICGINQIVADNSDRMLLNISDAVQENSSFDIQCDQLIFDDNLAEMKKDLKGKQFISTKKDAVNFLNISSSGQIVLKKMSWADTFKFKAVN